MAPSHHSILLFFMILGAVSATPLPTLDNPSSNQERGYKLPLNTSNTSLPSSGERYMTVSNQEQGYVTGGSLVSFDDKLLAEEKSDILDSLLFAELSASGVYDKTASFSLWYNLYITVLQETGWDIKSLGFRRYNPATNTPFTLISRVWNFLSPLCAAIQREVRISIAQLGRMVVVKYSYM